MKTILAKYALILASLLVIFLLEGCASTATGGYSNNTPINSSQTASNNNSNTLLPLIIMLQGKAMEQSSISLQISEINAQYIDNRGAVRWQKIADKKDLANSLPAMPFVASDKDTLALVAKVTVPNRKYQQIALKVQTTKSFMMHEKKQLPLEFASLLISTTDWELAATGNNILTININAENTTITERVAKLATNALSATASQATGSIRVKLLAAPKSPVTIAAAWGNSTKPFSNPAIADEENTFTIDKLPPGDYRLILNSNDYKLPDNLEPIPVKDGISEIAELQLQAVAK